MIKFSDIQSRRGTFVIDRTIIETNINLVMNLLKNCLIYSADIIDYFDKIRYCAMSLSFDKLNPGEFDKKYGIIHHYTILKEDKYVNKKGDRILYKLTFDNKSEFDSIVDD